VGAPCEINTVGIGSGAIDNYSNDALDLRRIYMPMMAMRVTWDIYFL
jgi:hypothetical protein